SGHKFSGLDSHLVGLSSERSISADQHDCEWHVYRRTVHGYRKPSGGPDLTGTKGSAHLNEEPTSFVERTVEKSTHWLVGATIGLVSGLLIFGGMATAYLGGALLLGWAAASFVPAFQGYPTLAVVMVLTGFVLLAIDFIYMIFRPKKMRETFLKLYHQLPVNKDDEYLSLEQQEHFVRAIVRSMLLGFFIVTVVFESAYAASVSYGLQSMYPDLKLFAEQTEVGPFAHFVFWLAIPIDLFLLDAPSEFGFGLSELSPNRDVLGLLIAVFVFKTVLVASSLRLFIEAIRFKAAEK
ncbi:MAG: hypothetical protein AAGA89_00005, partial [Pseudomonadota bacterium]